MTPQARSQTAQLRPAFKGLWAGVGTVALFSAIINILMLTGPIFMLQVYDRVLGSRSSSTLLVLFAITTYLFVLMGLLDHFRGRILARLGARLQTALDRRVLGASLRQAEHPHTSDQAATPLRDLGHIQSLFAAPALGAVFDLPWTPLFVALLFLFHPLMGWLAAAAALLVLVLALINQRSTRIALGRAAEAGAEAEAHASAMRGEIETLRGLGMEANSSNRWQEVRATALKNAMRASSLGGAITAATKALRLLLQSAMLAVGAFLVLEGQLTAGAMIAGSILLGRTLAPVEQTVAQWPLIQRALAARHRLKILLAKVPEPRQPMELPDPAPHLSVKDLVVIPPGKTTPALQGVTFAAEPGDVIAVIGPSASGKTTLARALTGLWPAIRGEIRLGGATLDQYEADRLGQLMGYVPQKVVLFAGTVAQNIARFQPDADPKAIVAAAQASAAHELILSLPQGYDTLLGNGGAGLSGGQRQRIGLARAFYGNPVTLVLDEPNASLDEPGLHALNRAIAKAREAHRIVFVMSHRPSALAEANKVLLIENGMMRAFGPRDEVLSRFVKNASAVVQPVRAG